MQAIQDDGCIRSTKLSPTDVIPKGSFFGGEVVPIGTFHGGDSVPPGTFH